MTDVHYGPTLSISEEIHAGKYRNSNETFKEAMSRVANTLKDNEEHYYKFRDILYNQRFLPGGRVQSAMGSARQVTAMNCYVMNTIPDSMDGIMEVLAEAAETLRMGGGVGYDFSTLRPRGARIKSLDSSSSGPLGFMGVFDALCACISSAGHRRGAQMGVLRVDHPDIEEFVTAKNNSTVLTNFNTSVLITDKFMAAVKANDSFDLVFEGTVYKTISARNLWDTIMRNTWDWAEPGVIFIDRVNDKNNLHYCEVIAATNPCGEQPLPPYGACLLGSLNVTKYVYDITLNNGGINRINYEKMKHDIPYIVRAMDNVIDNTIYPLEKQKEEAYNKRRMGLGVTGMANAIEALGYPYASDEYIKEQEKILTILRDGAYRTSVELAIEKGPFPLFKQEYLDSGFAKTLPEDIRELIKTHGIRNSHLLSIAPTGTISLTADNVSSGIEPVFNYGYDRTIRHFDSVKVERVEDYGYRVFGAKGRTADSLGPFDHVRVLNSASALVDSACSKTCNIGADVTWEEFKRVYEMAYEGGSSGCTTFRADGKRYGILNASAVEDVYKEEEPEEDNFIDEGTACYFDLVTGQKECS